MQVHRLQEFAQALEAKGLLQTAVMPDPAQPIGYLSYDSRDLGQDTLFVCKGAAFKEEYLLQVLANGAAGYVAETVYPNVYRDIFALVWIVSFPDRNTRLIRKGELFLFSYRHNVQLT